MIDALMTALANLTEPATFVYLIAGVLLGLVVGVLPGFGGTVGMAVLLPFVYGMDPTHGVVMLIGVMSVVATADTFPAVLMGIPGSVSSQATVIDGFALAKKGESARALGAAFSASLIGGVFGAIILTFAVFIARPLVLAFGAGEMLMLIVFGLTLVATLTERSMAKGLAAACLGLAIGAIGTAPATSEYRMVFDNAYLARGLPLTIVALAMFAIPEIIDLMRRDAAISERNALGSGWMRGLRDTLANWWLVIRCSGMGVIIGMLPGLGGAVVDWIAYGHANQTVRKPQIFGQGDIRGVIAPESANNAKEGGALIPTLIFAIPGSGVTAIFLGGLVLLGFEPGLTMATRQLDVIYLIVWALAAANVIGAAICFGLAAPISSLTRINFNILAPFVLILIYFSAYQASHNVQDLVALTVLGILAVNMRRFGYSRPALMIGFVLADGLETNLYQTISFYGWSVLSRPLVIAITIGALLSAFAALKLAKGSDAQGPTVIYHKSPAQTGFALMLLAVGIAVILQTANLNFQGAVFPVAAGAALCAFAIWSAWGTTRPAGHPGILDLEQPSADLHQATSTWSQLMWPIALLIGTLVIGFLPSVAIFVAVFLHKRAKLGWLRASFGAAAGIVGLLVLGKALRLEYPLGAVLNYLEILQ